MFKITTSCGKMVKSYNVYEILECVRSTKGSEYQFYVDFSPVSHTEFGKIFLNVSRDGQAYTEFEALINPRIDFIDYGRKKEKMGNEVPGLFFEGR